MPLVHLPHPLLKRRLRAVESAKLQDGAYAALLKRMREDMKTNSGVGLAANQIGEDLALFVIDSALAAEHGVPDAFANPEITHASHGRDEMEEGCLSIPGFWAPVTRSRKVMFKALDEHGTKVKFRARGMLARVLQHETDHVNGMTIRDRSGNQKPRPRTSKGRGRA